jgi:hypothetical protein
LFLPRMTTNRAVLTALVGLCVMMCPATLDTDVARTSTSGDIKGGRTWVG